MRPATPCGEEAQVKARMNAPYMRDSHVLKGQEDTMTGRDNSRDYDDVPGTYVLDSRSYRKGYHLNMFCMTLNKAECREEFARDEMAYLQKFPMSDEQRRAVLDRDYIRLLQLGANVYYTFKIVSHDRQPPQVMYGKMSTPPMSFDEFQQMMINGGRPIEGNRSKTED